MLPRGSLDGETNNTLFLVEPTVQVDALNSTMLDQQVSEFGHVDTLGPLFTFRNGTIHLPAGQAVSNGTVYLDGFGNNGTTMAYTTWLYVIISS